jgi:peptide-methionine (S)-S-oxide reductase
MKENLTTATLAGGCFWCLEAVFDEIRGVESVESGYSGGKVPNPSYRDVCTGATGHAEAVQVKFDPAVVSYRDLLNVFFGIHDPTTLNRQGADTGTQYRSVIFYNNDAQRATAEKSKAEAQKEFGHPIVTEIKPLTKFFRAEGYHQDYYRNNSSEPYCQMIIRPKLDKLDKKLKKP